MAIPLTNITIPTPQPYDKQSPTRQQEDYYYVWLQIMQTAKAAGESVTLNPSTSLNVDLAELVTAIKDLACTGERIEIPTLGLKLVRIGKTLTLIRQ